MRKVQLTIKQEEVAPATTSDLVVMSDGNTLKEELSTNVLDKFSREVTVDTSMSKVIDGTLDGAYESGVMYGRSLVNLSNLHKSFNDVTLSDYYFDTSLCETSKLKLGTPYTLVFYTTVHGGDHDIYSAFELGVSNSLHSTNAHPKTTTNHWGTLVKNGWSKVCVTFTDFLGYKYLSLRPIRCHAPESGKSIRFSIEGFILLEGDWSNKDLPFNDYFDGIGYCKMPILRNVGKNLLTREYTLNSATLVEETNEYVMTKGSGNIGGGLVFTPNLTPNKTYSFSVTAKTNRTDDGGIRVYNNTRKEYINVYLAGLTTQAQKVGGVFTVPSTHQMGDEFKIWIGKNAAYDLETTFTIYKDWQLEESSSITTYEDYKTNILHTPETVTLRSLPNGVRDELNVMTGEYIKRIGEVVLDGTQNWTLKTGNWEFENTFGFVTTISDMINTTHSHPAHSNGNSLVCSHFPSYGGNSLSNNALPNDIEMIGIDLNRLLGLRITKTKLSTPNAEGLKTWLRDNPVTVQYELAEPVTTIVKPLTVPFAYENGHIILESGFEGQSLLPELKYSAPASKNGVISTTSKAILKHEQRLHKFEDLLLRESILMDYRLMLTMLDSM